MWRKERCIPCMYSNGMETQTSSYQTHFHVLLKPFSSPHQHIENSRFLKYIARWISIFNSLLTRMKMNCTILMVGCHKIRTVCFTEHKPLPRSMQTPQSVAILTVWTRPPCPSSGSLRIFLNRRSYSHEADRITYVIILSIRLFY